MNKLNVIILLFLILLAGCSKSKKSKVIDYTNLDTTSVKVIQQSIDLGEINQGEKVLAFFKIVNTGTNPLFIKDIKTSCGCTVADFPHYLIEPKDTVTIKVEFDSQGFYGFQHKLIYVYLNTKDSVITLELFANVK